MDVSQEPVSVLVRLQQVNDGGPQVQDSVQMGSRKVRSHGLVAHREHRGQHVLFE